MVGAAYLTTTSERTTPKMALIDWYIAVLYENGVKTAWLRNAQQIEETAETSPPLGREYYYANLSQTRTARVRFVARLGNIESRNIPPNTPETFVRLPMTYNNYDGWREFGWVQTWFCYGTPSTTRVGLRDVDESRGGAKAKGAAGAAV
jgi:hypothetical protein